MADKQTCICLGVYPQVELAHADFEDLRILHNSGRIGAYDAVVFSKDADGKVHAHKRETPSEHGTWGGVAAGAAVGLLFAPTIIGAAVAGGIAGRVVGHMRKGLSKGDIKELEASLGDGESALLVVGAPELTQQTERILSRSRKRVVKPLDVEHKAFVQALAEAEQEHGDTLKDTLKHD